MIGLSIHLPINDTEIVSLHHCMCVDDSCAGRGLASKEDHMTQAQTAIILCWGVTSIKDGHFCSGFQLPFGLIDSFPRLHMADANTCGTVTILSIKGFSFFSKTTGGFSVSVSLCFALLHRALVLTPPSFLLDFWLYIMMVTFALVASLTPYC
ncbi:hypothetical protein GQ457_06G028900 [Hibiscus cannabinus]